MFVNMHTHTHTHTHLKDVGRDDFKPLAMVGHTLEVGIIAEDHLEYIQEELQRVLVEEVDLQRERETAELVSI